VAADLTPTTVVGVLLGQQTGREVSIVNSFELVYFDNHDIKLDEEFFTTRREQCKSLSTRHF
jgi:hypothetical protein